MERILNVENIYKTYSKKKDTFTKVLSGISFEILKSEFVAIVGPSGVGKSTLLHLLGSLDLPDEGTIEYFINGESLSLTKLNAANIATFRNKNVGFIFQFHHLLPEFNALENIMIPALIAGISQNEARKTAADLLEIVGVSNRSNHKPAELSGGEQQRVAIARALINKPSVILADEPTGNLDSVNARSILNLLSDLKERFSLTAIVATHSAKVASAADRILNMQDGRIMVND